MSEHNGEEEKPCSMELFLEDKLECREGVCPKPIFMMAMRRGWTPGKNLELCTHVQSVCGIFDQRL